jgi:hypothetical protein
MRSWEARTLFGVMLIALAATACVGVSSAAADSGIRFSSGGDDGTNGGVADTDVGSSRLYSTEMANNGANAGTIDGVSVTGTGASSFAVITDPASPYDGNCAPYPHTLQANPGLPFKCNLYVRFAPCAVGTVTATITVFTSNVMHSNQVLTLTGTGTGSGSCTSTDPGGGGTTAPPPTSAPAPKKKKKCKRGRKLKHGKCVKKKKP